MWWTLIGRDGSVTHITDSDFDVRAFRAQLKNGNQGYGMDVVRMVRGRVYLTISGAVVE